MNINDRHSNQILSTYLNSYLYIWHAVWSQQDRKIGKFRVVLHIIKSFESKKIKSYWIEMVACKYILSDKISICTTMKHNMKSKEISKPK